MKKIYTVLILYVALVQNISAQSKAETESQGLEQLRMEMEQRVQEEIQTRFVSSFSFNDSDMENSQGDEMSTPSFFRISIPYTKEKAMPSKAAL